MRKREKRRMNKEISASYYQKNKEKWVAYAQSHRVQIREYDRIHKLESKKVALSHYGNGKLECVKCGFTDIRALTIDHMNGRGSEHRKEIRIHNIYQWLIDNNFPEGFQTLCMNCQWIKMNENMEYAGIKKGEVQYAKQDLPTLWSFKPDVS